MTLTDPKKPAARVLTGSRTTGNPHIGNYYGAFKPAISLQEKHELFFFLADMHSINELPKPDKLRHDSLEMIATMLASGLDPNNGCFFAQSGVPEIHELAWFLGCVAPHAFLLRAHSYKDAIAKGKDANMGLFNYPLLMSADILLYDATLVPVGKDQKQHLEFARDFAQKFNNQYRPLFVVPEPIISEEVGLVPGTDGEKMSKSKNNTIMMYATDAEWKKQVMAIVTDAKGLDDPKDPDTCNVFNIYKVVASKAEADEMARKYRAGGYGYGHAKIALLEKVKETFTPKREKYFDLMKKPDDLRDIIRTGCQKARAIGQEKLKKIHDAVGLMI